MDTLYKQSYYEVCNTSLDDVPFPVQYYTVASTTTISHITWIVLYSVVVNNASKKARGCGKGGWRGWGEEIRTGGVMGYNVWNRMRYRMSRWRFTSACEMNGRGCGWLKGQRSTRKRVLSGADLSVGGEGVETDEPKFPQALDRCGKVKGGEDE